MIVKSGNEIGGIGLDFGKNSFYQSGTVETPVRDDRDDNWKSYETDKALTAVGLTKAMNTVGKGIAKIVPYQSAVGITGVSQYACIQLYTANLFGMFYFMEDKTWAFEGEILARGMTNPNGQINNDMGLVTFPFSQKTLTGYNYCSNVYPITSRQGCGNWTYPQNGFFSCAMINYNTQVRFNCAIGEYPNSGSALEAWISPLPIWAEGTYKDYEIFTGMSAT